MARKAMVPLPCWSRNRAVRRENRSGRCGPDRGRIRHDPGLAVDYFRNNYNEFASLRASIIRLHGLVDANARGRELPEVTVERRGWIGRNRRRRGAKANGEQLIDPLEVRTQQRGRPGRHGPFPGRARRTLLRSLAQLWPYASGVLRAAPATRHDVLVQLPYVPLGNLRGVVSYPKSPGDLSDAAVCDAFDQEVRWLHWPAHLDEEQAAAESPCPPVSSSGLPFAPVLLAKLRRCSG